MLYMGTYRGAYCSELLVAAVVEAKEREYSVEHGPLFVNLVTLVHGLVSLVDQV